jgi:hypothetical protein
VAAWVFFEAKGVLPAHGHHGYRGFYYCMGKTGINEAGMAKRVRVNRSDLAAITCPHCSSMKLISVNKFKGVKHTLKVKCTCANSFSVSLDFRGRYRKSTNIPAKYVRLDKDMKKMGQQLVPNLKCKVADLSLSGLALTISGSHDLQVGDDLMVEFFLDDTAKTHLKRRTIVRVIGSGFVGCQFDEVDSPAYDKALGFYLMP